jgi:hypothetical protein
VLDSSDDNSKNTMYLLKCDLAKKQTKIVDKKQVDVVDTFGSSPIVFDSADRHRFLFFQNEDTDPAKFSELQVVASKLVVKMQFDGSFSGLHRESLRLEGKYILTSYLNNKILGDKIRGCTRLGQNFNFKELTLADGQIQCAELCEIQSELLAENVVSMF